MTNPPFGLDRRTFLKATGAGAAVSSLAFGTAATADESLDDQLAKAEKATEKYADPQTALDDGFQPMGPFVPGMGWHFLNAANVEAAVEDGFDIEKPQLLTYGDAGGGCNGELVLGSVEYAVPVGAGEHDEENPPDIFDDEDSSERWHVHSTAEHVLALPVDPHEGVSDDFPESPADVPLADQLRTTNWVEVTPGGEPGSPMFEHGMMIVADLEGGEAIDMRAVVGAAVHPDLLTLHAWVHLENPDGVFAPINPELPSTPQT